MRKHHALALLALALPSAPAAAAGVEVCDLPPRFGIEPAAAAIVRTACEEHRLWTRPFIEADGRLAWLGVTESESSALADGITPAWQRVARYWRDSGTLYPMASSAGANSCIYPGGVRATDNDCRAFIADNPWSAAFISWVMARAPLPGFHGSPRHMDYIARAWRDPTGSPYLYSDPFTGRPTPGDLLCFLRADDQGRGPEGLRQALSGQAPLPVRSHCDIVVAANVGGDRTLYLIGGNVLNTVMMRKLPLDASGRLLPGPLQAAAEGALRGPEAVAGQPVTDASAAAAAAATSVAAATSSMAPSDDIVPAACRPGNPSACSFNRRDWVALLKLKPQAQLPGGVPPVAPVSTYTPATGAAPSNAGATPAGTSAPPAPVQPANSVVPAPVPVTAPAAQPSGIPPASSTTPPATPAPATPQTTSPQPQPATTPPPGG
ncbi:DUF2272 domain-containing protein [Pseudoxanthomonas suwonensis]|uniref:DUF2272 domain-containing protein n=1 Tax=Pseudoxanthomonas suwonensis TaxID=314722 RepID=UPI000464191B|nr:DUF2272 domain-containing protein [Pseudoxanthomonas suwonensis]